MSAFAADIFSLGAREPELRLHQVHRLAKARMPRGNDAGRRRGFSAGRLAGRRGRRAYLDDPRECKTNGDRACQEGYCWDGRYDPFSAMRFHSQQDWNSSALCRGLCCRDCGFCH